MNAMMLWTTLLTLPITSCSFSSEWVTTIEDPVVATWFAIPAATEARIAVVTGPTADDVRFDVHALEDPIAAALRSTFLRSEIVSLAAFNATWSIEQALRSAREQHCSWLSVLVLLDVNQDQTTEDEIVTEPDGEMLTETSFCSRTQVHAQLELYRVSDGARGFSVGGVDARIDAELQDDDYGKFPNWLIMWLFASADYPPYPDPLPIAEHLVVRLVGELPRLTTHAQIVAPIR